MRKERRGLALVLVLFSTVLLTMLVGAFFQINRDNFNLAGASQRRMEAQLAAESGLTYARYKLEENQSWGKLAFANYPEVLGPLRVSVDGTGLLGEFADGRTFHLQVDNCLDLPAAAGVPKDSVLLTVQGSSGFFRWGAKMLLVGEPLYDAAVTSNGKLDMRENKDWQVHSKDKIRNWVRSNDAIYANDVFSATNTTRFISDVGSNVPGILWSKKDIYAQNTLLSGSTLASFNNSVSGIAAPRSTKNNNIYDLKLTDLKVPGAPTAMPAGRYVLTEALAIPVNEEVKSHPWPFPDTVKQVDQPPAAIRALAFYPDGGGSPSIYYPQSELSRVAGSGTPPVRPPAYGTLTGNVVAFHGIPDFTFDFSTNDFSLSGSKQYQVDGNFAIGYEAPSTGALMARPDTDIIFSSGANPTFLNVTGNFNVDGKVKGRGAVAAEKEMMMRANADLSASNTDPLVLWGGGNITIDASNKGDVQFSGLIYAANNFSINSTTPLNKVNLTGALVARNGSISMAAANTVNMTYDPAYLTTLTKGLPNNRRRLTVMSWLPI